MVAARNAMLTLRQLIPPLTARTAAGDVVRAWDYKQKKSLLIAFLHGDCPHCQSLAARLASRAADLLERDSVALVIFLEAPPARLSATPPVILASETTGRAAQEYLGTDAFGTQGLARVGLFVADRYGELFAQWEARDADGLPALAEAFKWLAHTQMGCEECSTSHWPTGE
jgi:peroxiredoxin